MCCAKCWQQWCEATIAITQPSDCKHILLRMKLAWQAETGVAASHGILPYSLQYRKLLLHLVGSLAPCQDSEIPDPATSESTENC